MVASLYKNLVTISSATLGKSFEVLNASTMHFLRLVYIYLSSFSSIHDFSKSVEIDEDTTSPSVMNWLGQSKYGAKRWTINDYRASCILGLVAYARVALDKNCSTFSFR